MKTVTPRAVARACLRILGLVLLAAVPAAFFISASHYIMDTQLNIPGWDQITSGAWFNIWPILGATAVSAFLWRLDKELRLFSITFFTESILIHVYLLYYFMAGKAAQVGL